MRARARHQDILPLIAGASIRADAMLATTLCTWSMGDQSAPRDGPSSRAMALLRFICCCLWNDWTGAKFFIKSLVRHWMSCGVVSATLTFTRVTCEHFMLMHSLWLSGGEETEWRNESKGHIDKHTGSVHVVLSSDSNKQTSANKSVQGEITVGKAKVTAIMRETVAMYTFIEQMFHAWYTRTTREDDKRLT